ncbi:hypothetical protein HZH66_013499 [Vespula vulgaris]|uniref:Uncharacterized protein n=1 Tax=Vespula vulgaris TaxID=7454 RepID=A0A834MQX5_VESVU|nr:hypothetical protein HZH66_013499 [Vespula vulgaris]
MASSNSSSSSCSHGGGSGGGGSNSTTPPNVPTLSQCLNCPPNAYLQYSAIYGEARVVVARLMDSIFCERVHEFDFGYTFELMRRNNNNDDDDNDDDDDEDDDDEDDDVIMDL